MSFLNEIEFEKHLRNDVLVPLLKKQSEYYLMESKKAVDILICKNGKVPALYFIEVKYHRHNHRRLGFGHAKGGGFQPELLINNPAYFRSNMRWILGVEDKDGYLFMTNDKITQSLNGGKVEKKYNGIRPKIFKENTFLNAAELKKEISIWLGIE
jgi:hypothetical protein